ILCYSLFSLCLLRLSRTGSPADVAYQTPTITMETGVCTVVDIHSTINAINAVVFGPIKNMAIRAIGTGTSTREIATAVGRVENTLLFVLWASTVHMPLQ
ncbi:hypothetical protein Tcan_08990, partial [Toxocara canis]